MIAGFDFDELEMLYAMLKRILAKLGYGSPLSLNVHNWGGAPLSARPPAGRAARPAGTSSAGGRITRTAAIGSSRQVTLCSRSAIQLPFCNV